MQMVMSMKETGWMIKLMDEDSTLIQMDQGMKESGKMINNMALELRDGQTEHNMKDSILKGRNMEKASLFGLIRVLTMESLLIITSRGWVFTSGLMAGSTMVNGSITRCRVMAHSLGQMEGSMWASMMMT